jgi:hypothetical protein
MTVTPLIVRKQRRENSPPVPPRQNPRERQIVRRKTVEVTVPGTYMKYRPTPSHDKKLEQHARLRLRW